MAEDLFNNNPSVIPTETLVQDTPAPGVEEEEDDEEVKEDTYLLKLPIPEKDLPPVIREFVQNAPPSRKIPTFLVCMVCLAVLATRIRIRYPFDKRLHMLLLQVIIEGEPSAGKGFVNDIVTRIIGPTLSQHDELQRLKEQEFREKKQTRKANEKIGEAPKTTIREIPANISKTVLVKRADLSKRLLGDVTSFWMYAEELAQLTDAGKAAYSNLRTIMRVAYDLGSKFGIDFASDNSYSAIADINICSLFLATPNDVDDYMDKRSVMGGNCTRNIIYTLSDELGSSAAEFRDLTDDQDVNISRILQKMMDDTYNEDGSLRPTILLNMDWNERDIRKWCKTKASNSLSGTGRAYYVFHKRSSLSSDRGGAALCYYLYSLENGFDPTVAHDSGAATTYQRRCRKIYRWLSELIHDGLLTRWGNQYDCLNARRKEGVQPDSRKPLIEQLPQQFTREQLTVLIHQNDMSTEARFFISQWTAKGWIRKIRKNVYEKLV